ncbi:hypothetical protein J6590_067233 [Homalodisca vitripennis]|nr:hypothetical protein J6590_067233 [Homalodisca vitripennis]
MSSVNRRGQVGGGTLGYTCTERLICTTFSIGRPITTGHSPIPWALTGEFFPSSVKAKGATLSTVIFCGESFILINLFPQITAFFGLPNTCWIASINLFLGSIFVALCVPETSGLSFLQIQELLNK